VDPIKSLSLRIANPFSLRESLLIALEVTWPDMAPDKVELVKRFAVGLPRQVGPTAAAIDVEEQRALLTCTGHFRQRRSWYWLREDLGEAVTAMERQLRVK
jgi:hypothetical protein